MYLASILAANSTRGQKSKRAKSTYPSVSVLTQELGSRNGHECIVYEWVYRTDYGKIEHFEHLQAYTINETTGKAETVPGLFGDYYLDDQRYKLPINESVARQMMGESTFDREVHYRVRNKNGSTLVEIFKEVEEAKMNGASLDELVKKYELTVWEGFDNDHDQVQFEEDSDDE